MSGVDYSKKIFAIITGASQGIGRTISVELGRRLVYGSKIILIARSQSNLNETRKLIADINDSISIVVCCIDLANTDLSSCTTILEDSFSDIKNDTYDVAMIFHNAGQAGVLQDTRDLTDQDIWRSYYTLNLFGSIVLNSLFLNKTDHIKSTFVINVTSMLSREPIESMSMYCSVKAARNMFFSVLALEEPDLRVLSYSPGPVDTDMFNTIADHAKSVRTKEAFCKVRDENGVLTTEQTVGKLLSTLEEGGYKSGDFVDYFGRE